MDPTGGTTAVADTPPDRLASARDYTGWSLDWRITALSAAGWLQIAAVLPAFHFLIFVANVAAAFWLSLRPWKWTTKYAAFLLAEAVYFFVKFRIPRPGYDMNVVFGRLLPSGAYFGFLWSAVEVIVFLKLADFVLCRTAARDAREFSFARLVAFVAYPFTFLAGPVIGFEEFYRSRYSDRGSDDVWYAVRKCVWGAVQLFIVAVWLHDAVMDLRRAVLLDEPLAQAVDTRLLMAVWLAGLSVLLHVIYKGYVDIMLGLSRMAGFRFPEQFHFTLLSRDPIEYWQHGNRGVYRMTSQYIFSRFFKHDRILAKTLMATTVSGLVHALMSQHITLAGMLLLVVLFGSTGVVVGVLLLARRTDVMKHAHWPETGPAHNALVLSGVALTFALMAVPRSAFLLLVEGVPVAQWWDLVSRVFVAA